MEPTLRLTNRPGHGLRVDALHLRCSGPCDDSPRECSQVLPQCRCRGRHGIGTISAGSVRAGWARFCTESAGAIRIAREGVRCTMSTAARGRSSASVFVLFSRRAPCRLTYHRSVHGSDHGSEDGSATADSVTMAATMEALLLDLSSIHVRARTTPSLSLPHGVTCICSSR